MKRSNSFKPSTMELEDRLALSGATAWVAPLSASFTPGQVLAVQLEQSAISTFAQGYQAAVQSTLLAPGSGGVVTPSANRAAFDAQVASLLTTLQASLVKDVKYLPGSATLTSDVQAIVTGVGPNSLQSQLNALPTPSGPSGLSFAVFQVRAVASLAMADANLTSDVLGYGPITSIG